MQAVWKNVYFSVSCEYKYQIQIKIKNPLLPFV